MKMLVMCVLTLLIACGIASADVQTFDTLGFEGYSLGDLSGQDGWYTELYGGTATIVDNAADPAEGSKALKLTAPSSVVDTGSLVGDAIYLSHTITTSPLNWARVSFDIWREPGTVAVADATFDKSAMNRLHWWSASAASPIGAQWEDGATYPFLSSVNSALTVTGAFTNLTLYYDFVAKTRSSWYNGVQVDNAILMEDSNMKGLGDIELYYEQISPNGQAGTFGYAAYIDNLHVEYEVTSVPEPGSIVALATGLVGLIGLRRRRL